jgi:hypothetical protein
MRETFHDELGDMCAQAADAIRRATQVLLTADRPLAEQVLSADDSFAAPQQV